MDAHSLTARPSGLHASRSNSPIAARFRATVVTILGLYLAAPPAWAVIEDRYWVCGDGDWSNGACWSLTAGGPGGASLPNQTNTYIESSDATDRTVSLSADLNLYSLHINGTGDGTPTLAKSDGYLYATYLMIGDTGRGAVTQTGGDTEANFSFVIGSGGSFDLSGGTATSNQHVTVDSGATVTHSGGTLSAVDHSGSSLSLSGTYELSGTGIVDTWHTMVGVGGTGQFIQAGGTHNVTNSLYLGRSAGDDGTYEMSGGELYVGSVAYVGWAGDGHFIQDDGTHNVFALYLGFDTNAYGSPPPTSISTYDLHGGTLNAGYEAIGIRGESIFTQTGGTHIAQNELAIGGNYAAGSEATYNLTDGTLESAKEIIGGYYNPGVLNQDGGTNTAGVMVFKAPSDAWTQYQDTGDDSRFGRYNLNGGTLHVTGGTVFGQRDGVLNIDGGTLDIGGATLNLDSMAVLNIGHAAGRVGSFTMQNGRIDTLEETVGGAGSGTFTQTDGDHRVLYDLFIAREAGSEGTFNLQGGELWASRVQNNGTFNYTGGSLRVTGLSDSAFTNGQAQPGGGIDPNAFFNIENTTVTVIGDVVNYGTILLANADVDFTSGTVTNNGGLITDPSTLRFSVLEIGPNGFLVAGPGDSFVIEGDFLNFSEQGSLWNTTGASLVFSGAGAHELHLADSANPASFGWGALELVDGATLNLTGDTAGGLLVTELILGAGSMLNLNGANLFVSSLVDNGGSYVNGNILPATAVPLPAGWPLLASGLGVIAARWRKAGATRSTPPGGIRNASC